MMDNASCEPVGIVKQLEFMRYIPYQQNFPNIIPSAPWYPKNFVAKVEPSWKFEQQQQQQLIQAIHLSANKNHIPQVI